MTPPKPLCRAALAGVLVLSCGTQERAPDEKAALGGEVAARVGGEAIPLAIVAEVARAQRISARDAARKVIDDEIAANAARARGLDKKQPAAWALIATRARLVSDRLLDEAKRKGPPTDKEVETLSARHWVEVDRPPTLRVIHAIAITQGKPENLAAAREVGKRLHEAVRGATSPDDFEKRAKAVEHPKAIEVRVERLPLFTRDGRIQGVSNIMDKQFAEGAFALPGPDATSGPVESQYGVHVIRIIESVPEARMPFEARRVAFQEETYAMRSHNAASEILKAQAARHPVQISPAAESLMSSVPVRNEQASAR